ncbi:flagellar biosynthesis protein FlhA [Nocardioides caldifontis]|uniref:flagellar biosynthesis protein FlhA n=1 Tax=Nocardioides caldifontis TaxID=2588938 RepID=UPI00193A8447|nr:flagellar biosynthesis protein FlhA [Nocardioides caldifontis]
MKRMTQLGVPVGVVLIVVMLVVPLPAVLLDLLLAFNISLSVLILLTAMFVSKPLDFAAFPAVILVLTLFRLALNISSTRLVLTDGYAGKVIETFGGFVVGGSLVVGLVVFLILVIIQFVVITNGAGRVAEVGARFTLDAMPGKQMAIDADLNAGLIDDEEARRRRKEVAAEADFYGAMDGGTKFVKGDAIAGIIITLINLIGGFAIGVAQKGMTLNDAMHTYSLLTVGDGLVSQIPALLLSVATGLVVTRSVSEGDMGSDIIRQLGQHKLPLRVAGAAAIGLCLIPGLPKLPFLVVGGAILLASSRITEDGETPSPEAVAAAELTPPAETPEDMLADTLLDPIGLELSADLIDLVDPATGGDLLDRVKALRKKVASDIGIVMPPVRTRDNLELPLRTYAITLFGVEVARGEAPPGTVLAIGEFLSMLPGTPVKEPVFGLDAKWIPAELRAQAEISGITVVDRSSVVTTHLADVVRHHAARLLSREDVKLLTDVVKRSHPVVVEELTAQLSLGEVQRVLQGLLDEQVPIRDLVRIFEALSLKARETKDPESLVEFARGTLGAAIVQPHLNEGAVHVISFEPQLEQRMLEALRPTEEGSVVAFDMETGQVVLTELARMMAEAENRNLTPVVACAPQLRPAVRRMVQPSLGRLPVVSYRELSGTAQVRSVGVVTGRLAAVSL